jgi:hypothetical protein
MLSDRRGKTAMKHPIESGSLTMMLTLPLMAVFARS